MLALLPGAALLFVLAMWAGVMAGARARRRASAFGGASSRPGDGTSLSATAGPSPAAGQAHARSLKASFSTLAGTSHPRPRHLSSHVSQLPGSPQQQRPREQRPPELQTATSSNPPWPDLLADSAGCLGDSAPAGASPGLMLSPQPTCVGAACGGKLCSRVHCSGCVSREAVSAPPTTARNPLSSSSARVGALSEDGAGSRVMSMDHVDHGVHEGLVAAAAAEPAGPAPVSPALSYVRHAVTPALEPSPRLQPTVEAVESAHTRSSPLPTPCFARASALQPLRAAGPSQRHSTAEVPAPVAQVDVDLALASLQAAARSVGHAARRRSMGRRSARWRAASACGCSTSEGDSLDSTGGTDGDGPPGVLASPISALCSPALLRRPAHLQRSVLYTSCTSISITCAKVGLCREGM